MEINLSGAQFFIGTPAGFMHVGTVIEGTATIERETQIDWQAVIDTFTEPEIDWPEFLTA